MLNQCKDETVVTIYILNKPKGKWIKRAVFLNMDDDNFSKIFTRLCFTNDVCLNFKNCLEVDYMNIDTYNALPSHLKDLVNNMSPEMQDFLLPEQEIDWDYVNAVRHKFVFLALKESPFVLQHQSLYTMHYSILEFIDAMMQEQEFDEMYYTYDALSDVYQIIYVKTEPEPEPEPEPENGGENE